VPEISLFGAAGYRIRRNYGYLFLVTLVAWVLRLELEAGPGTSLSAVVAQAQIGGISGAVVAGAVLLPAPSVARSWPSWLRPSGCWTGRPSRRRSCRWRAPGSAARTSPR
jgi:hypothetical protein